MYLRPGLCLSHVQPPDERVDSCALSAPHGTLQAQIVDSCALLQPHSKPALGPAWADWIHKSAAEIVDSCMLSAPHSTLQAEYAACYKLLSPRSKPILSSSWADWMYCPRMILLTVVCFQHLTAPYRLNSSTVTCFYNTITNPS